MQNGQQQLQEIRHKIFKIAKQSMKDRRDVMGNE